MIWITEREREAGCFAVCTKAYDDLIGVLLLTEVDVHPEGCELRLGYFFAEQFWGLGFASELVRGLCDALIQTGRKMTITGGVESTNMASINVLIKNGFFLDPSESNTTMHIYKKHSK